ncbi:HD-GYP domain-containing protein [Candidatus Omnitrophota bacterium]
MTKKKKQIKNEEQFRIAGIIRPSKEKQELQAQGIKFPRLKPEEAKEAERQSEDKAGPAFVTGKALMPRRDDSTANALYSEAVSLARKVYKVQTDKDSLASGIYSLVERVVHLVINTEDSGLLKAALADYPSPEDYIYYHAVNVCIISLYIGLGLDYNPIRLNELGIAAFLHDIGLSRYLGIINKPKKLNLQEFSEIKQHPLIGPQMLGKIGESLNESIFEVIRQEHERIDGSGYPEGLEEDEIIEYAQIVGLSDVYEAMMHKRPHRAKQSSLEVIKVLLNGKYSFSRRLIKVLIERVGIFPVGTSVMLSTREVAEVLRENINSPLRPKVKIMLDATGKRLQELRQIDLANNPTVYISGIYPKAA